jgi:DNA topoisomerase-3
MTLLRGLGVNELTAPELTGEWEYKLSQMEKGKISRDEFMREIAQMTQVIVKRAKEYDNDTIPGDYHTMHTPCPNCGGVVKENYRRFACTKCEFSMSKTPGGRQFEIEEVEQLLKDRTIGPLQGFRSKMGRPFAAILRIVKDEEIKNFKLEFDFGQNDDSEDSEPVDFTGRPAGPVPEVQWRRVRNGPGVCVRTQRGETEDLRLPQRPHHPAAGDPARADGQAAQRRQDRPAARLHLAAHAPSVQGLPGEGQDGKISFEFEERKAKAPAKGKAAAAAADDGAAEEKKLRRKKPLQ